MKHASTPSPDVVAAQARRIMWKHGLTPCMARIIAELAYGEAA